MNLLNMGVNIVALEKNDKLYGMACAWATMVGVEELVLLLGSQSETANILEIGDKIGVSALNINQKDCAILFGSYHSSKKNKFINQDYSLNQGAITIKNAKVQMQCEVFNITRVKGNNEDFLVFAKVIAKEVNKKEKFLSMEDID